MKIYTTNSFFNSKSYKKNMQSSINDSTFLKYNTTRYFRLIGEESYLNSQGYDFYIVFQKSYWNDSLKIFTIKSKDSLTSISIKTFHDFNHIFLRNENESEFIKWPLQYCVKNRIIDKGSIVYIKSFLDSTTNLVQENLIDDGIYYEISSSVDYFDSINYHIFSNSTIGEPIMKRIDSLFFNDTQFKSLY